MKLLIAVKLNLTNLIIDVLQIPLAGCREAEVASSVYLGSASKTWTW